MPDLQNAIHVIDAHITDPHQGLGEDVFQLVSRLTPMVNVDLLVKNERGEILLTWRSDEFYGPGWHIPGGIVRFKETFHDRIHAVSHAELHATVEHDEMPCLVTQCINPTRQTRGHFISHLFACRLTSPLKDTLKYDPQSPTNGQWAWHTTLPDNFISEQRGIYGPLFPA
ncbi:NUDIX domain-containing protein [Magnetovibrio sp.]|uniref:NUDIX domain-containing protein n=1 Tax=Magnetovibrio sp. TaxID=2024836 RepID=UPI002F9385AF